MTSQGGLTWDTAGELLIGYLPDPTPNPNYDLLWWKVTPTKSGDVAFSSRDDPTGASYIYVYTGADEANSVRIASFSGTSRATGYDDRAYGFVHLDAGVEYHVSAWCNPDAIITATETYWSDWLQDPDETVNVQVAQEQHYVDKNTSISGLPGSSVTPSELNTYMNDLCDAKGDPVYTGDVTFLNDDLAAQVHLEASAGWNGPGDSYTRNASGQEYCYPVKFNVNRDMTGWTPYHSTYDFPVGALAVENNPEGYTYLATFMAAGQANIYYYRNGYGGQYSNSIYTNLKRLIPYGGAFELRLSPTNVLGSGRVVDNKNFSTIDVPSGDSWNIPEVSVDLSSDVDANGNCWLYPRVLKAGQWGQLENPIQTSIDVVLEHSSDIRNRIRPPRYRYLYARPALPPPAPEIAYVPDGVRRIFTMRS